jgi:hypothetical protein
MKRLLFVVSLCILGWHVNAQHMIEKTIILRDSTIVKSVELSIKKGTKELNFFIEGYLSSGELSFDITDPEGRHVGGFKLSAVDEHGKRSPSEGRMTHPVVLPIEGTWEVTIQTNKSNGDLMYRIEIK